MSSSLALALKSGRYRHYKNRDYQVLHVAQHSETEEYLVVYRCLYGDYSWWVRPLTMFTEAVLIDGQEKPRFAYVADMTAQELIEADAATAAAQQIAR